MCTSVFYHVQSVRYKARAFLGAAQGQCQAEQGHCQPGATSVGCREHRQGKGFLSLDNACAQGCLLKSPAAGSCSSPSSRFSAGFHLRAPSGWEEGREEHKSPQPSL